MNLQLTPELLDFLKIQGFHYCFSKTTLCSSNNYDVRISLTPTRIRPQIRRLPLEFDTFFAISKEPTQMSKGVSDVLITVNLDANTVGAYINSILKRKKLADLSAI